MVLTTTTSANGKYVIFTGTKQEVLDALDPYPQGHIVNWVVDGSSFSVLLRNTKL